jgi:hypothetical protein
MIGALTGGDTQLLVLILGIVVLLGAAYVAYIGRLAAAALIAVIGVLLLLFAS